jgi:Mn2+/Fe2+ NRAMP family transporter
VRFYIAIAAATIAGIAINFFHVDPIRALYWAAVLNGVLAAPLMGVILHMASSKRVMANLRFRSICGLLAGQPQR